MLSRNRSTSPVGAPASWELSLFIAGLAAAWVMVPEMATAEERPAAAGLSGPVVLGTITVLALDPFDGKAVVRFPGARLLVVTVGEELPTAPGAAAAVRLRIVGVLPDRLVLEEIAVEGSGGAAAAKRRVWVYKPSRPGLDSRIEILEREHPVPFVPDLNPATEMPEEPAAPGVAAPGVAAPGVTVRSARNLPSATGEEGGG